MKLPQIKRFIGLVGSSEEIVESTSGKGGQRVGEVARNARNLLQRGREGYSPTRSKRLPF